MTDAENRRTALNIKAGLASNLITVALGFIAAESAIAVFVLEKRGHLFFFYLIGISAFLALTASVMFGGYGIRDIYRDGFNDQWTLSDKGRFSLQALLCLVGAAFVLVSSVLP